MDAAALMLSKKIVDSYLMGLCIEKAPNTFFGGDFYVSVPKDGIKTYLGKPMIYGRELAKQFTNAMAEYNHTDKVKYKVRDEYWSIEDAMLMAKVLKEELGKLMGESSEFDDYESLYNSL